MSGTPQILGSVVAGIEEHRPSAALLRAAADEAERHNAGLAVVTVRQHRAAAPSLTTSAPGREGGEAELVRRVDALRRDRPWLGVTLHRLRSAEVGPDREPLSGAELLVIGAHGSAGGQAFGPETVSWRLLRAARCPVLVVPDQAGADSVQDPDRPRPVVLAGLSGKRSDPAVIGAAYAEVLRRHGDLHLLHAYTPGPRETLEDDLDRAIEVVHRATRRIAPPQGVRTSVILAEGRPASALGRQAAGAAVLVIAARSGSMAGLVSGAVSRSVLAEAPCPVLTVPWLLIDRGRTPGVTVEPSTSSTIGGA